MQRQQRRQQQRVGAWLTKTQPEVGLKMRLMSGSALLELRWSVECKAAGGVWDRDMMCVCSAEGGRWVPLNQNRILLWNTSFYGFF